MDGGQGAGEASDTQLTSTRVEGTMLGEQGQIFTVGQSGFFFPLRNVGV